MATLQPPSAPTPATSTSPKRKLGQMSVDERPHTPTLQQPIPKFSFEIPGPDDEDGNSSPRSKVAHKFQGLALGGVVAAESGAGSLASSSSTNPGNHGASGAAKRSAKMSFGGGNDMYDGHIEMQVDDAPTIRKRLKLPDDDTDSTPRKHGTTPTGFTTSVFAPVIDSSPNVPASMLEDSPDKKGSFNAGQSSTMSSPCKIGEEITLSQNPSDAKARSKRVGTAPLVSAKTSADGHSMDDSEMDVVDPVRAALTWQEDEITVYDPNDEEDDGVGINGIGFRPTAAIAHARSMKRRQQLAEYRKREEREARARRSLRRRASPKTGSEAVKAPDGDAQPASSLEPPARKVRFTDFEPTVVITT